MLEVRRPRSCFDDVGVVLLCTLTVCDKALCTGLQRMLRQNALNRFQSRRFFSCFLWWIRLVDPRDYRCRREALHSIISSAIMPEGVVG